MTDFFAHLAASYLGEAGGLRPRVPFRFEPVSALLAAADLPAAHREPEPHGASGPGQPAEPWPGPVGAVKAGQVPAIGYEPRSRGRRQVRPAARPVDLAAGTGPATVRPPHRQDRMAASATAERPRMAIPAAEPGAARAGPAGPGPVRREAVRQEAVRPGAVRQGPGQPTETGGARGREDGAGVAAASPDGAKARGPEVERAEWPGRPTAAAAALVPPWPPRPSRPGPGGDVDQTDMAALAGAGRSLRPSQLVRPPGPPDNFGGQPPVASDARAGGRPDRAVGEPSRPSSENITVQVTIGRVEVRAAPPPAASAPAARPPAGPGLADYLRNKSRPAGVRP